MAKRKNKRKVVASTPSSKEAVPLNEPPSQPILNQAVINNSLILSKLCRLCEGQDGPFLFIFGAETVISKKIEELMPFKIDENDDLPHKICFRCSAKVEEFHEFMQKCIKAQENLQKALGRKEKITIKDKDMSLAPTKLSNDDICDALIKKAMEDIKTTVKCDDDKSPLLNKQKESIEEHVEQKALNINVLRKDSKQKKQANIDKTETNIFATKNGKSKNDFSIDVDSDDDSVIINESEIKCEPNTNNKPNENIKVFDIMDHVCMVKVNGVGELFQCQMCNRNFLNKAVVLSHLCARSGGIPKTNISVRAVPAELPKKPTVKYINTHANEDTKKSLPAEQTPKVKIGPASKVKKPNVQQETSALTNSAPTVNISSPLHLNCSYKLVPGPNNILQLIQEDSSTKTSETVTSAAQNISQNIPTAEVSKMRKRSSKVLTPTPVSEIIDLEEPSEGLSVVPNITKAAPLSQLHIAQGMAAQQPYPVGLFQTRCDQDPHPALLPEPQITTFTTPAMKKQSYSILQTGNPGKIVISKIPQTPTEQPIGKKPKRPGTVEKKSLSNSSANQLGSLQPKEAGAIQDGSFRFVNVDPSTQPSYVLPTNNTIQESRISTSTAEARAAPAQHACNMCGETFAREQKMIAHIQSHFAKMDQEDKMRSDHLPAKRKSKRTS